MSVALVTGANGFLGRYLCRELSGRGGEVIALARSPGRGIGRSIVLSGLPTRENLAAVLETVRPDVVYHLAGTSRSDDLESLYQSNVLFAAHLLEAALGAGVRATVVLVGSAAEYGRPLHADGKVRETDSCSPISAYGISKLAQTHHGLAAAARGLPVVIGRLFNPIGAGGASTTALGSFVNQIAAMPAKGGALKTGPLNAVRDFVHVADAARILVDLAENPAARDQIVNLCTGVGTGLQHLVDRLIAISSVPLIHQLDPERHGTSDLDIVVGDATRLARLGVSIAAPDFDVVLRDILADARRDRGIAREAP